MDNRPDIREHAKHIAKELGATLLPLRKDRDNDQYPRIATPEGPELHVHYHWQTKRLVVGFNLPMIKNRRGDLEQQSPRDLAWQVKRDHGSEPVTSITVDPMKNACAIARDIKRRLLPAAIIWHTAALARKAQWEAHATGTAATIAQVCKALDFDYDPEKDGEMLYLPTVRMQISSPDSCHFERFYTDAETAIAIYKILQASKAGESDDE